MKTKTIYTPPYHYRKKRKKMKPPLQNGFISPSKMMTMQLSNLSYLLLALYMASRHYKGAALVFFVFAVSTIHHYFAYNKAWLYFDIFVAIAVSILLAFLYVPLENIASPTFISAIIIGGIALSLFFTSGAEYGSTKFELYHGLWHVLSAIAFYLILKSDGK